MARWHICQGSINAMAFSTDGAYLATVGRDGMLLVNPLINCACLILFYSPLCFLVPLIDEKT